MPKYICANTNIGQTLYKHLLARPRTRKDSLFNFSRSNRNAQFSETKLLQNKFKHLTDEVSIIFCVIIHIWDLSRCLKSSQGEEPKNGVKIK